MTFLSNDSSTNAHKTENIVNERTQRVGEGCSYSYAHPLNFDQDKTVVRKEYLKMYKNIFCDAATLTFDLLP